MVLLMAGLQVPVTPLVDVVGKAASAAPEQMDATAANVGVSAGVMFRLITKFVSQIFAPVTYTVS